MFGLMILNLLNLIWLGISYAIIYVLDKFVPNGVVIAQITFLYIWFLLPSINVTRIGLLNLDSLMYAWIIASIILMFFKYKNR